MKLKSKLFTGAVAFSMVLGLVAIPASAQTVAELQAQIASLLAQINQLSAQLSAAGGSTGSAVQYKTDLTIGSKGADVTSLQQWLVSKGHLVMPAGVAYGYFGPLTKAAVAKYQASAGVTPAVGYFGPLTRAKVNAMTVTTGDNTNTGGNTGGGGITTKGSEGSISVTLSNAGLPSTLYVGDKAAGVLGFKVEASNSDMNVQRVKLDLGTSTTVYNKVFSKVYITESGNVLASSDLNSSTVVKDGSRYYATVGGFSLVIPKGQSKYIVVKMDLNNSINTSYLYSDPIRLSANGVRAVDGAGIDQYGGDTTITKSPTISAALYDSSTLSVSLSPSSPKKNDVICSDGASNNQCDLLAVLSLDVKAEKDNIKITDINIAIAKTGAGAATASTTYYLFDGSTELANATGGALNTAVFSNFNQTISKDTTKTYTVKTDIRSANTTRASFVASASSTGITAESSRGSSVTKSGTATGNSIGVLNVGPQFTLVSKSISTNGVPQANGTTTNVSTSTITAIFNVKIKAIGGAIEFGTSQGTTSPLVASTTGFGVYRNGSVDATIGSNATSTSITFPSTCSTTGFTASCSLAEGSEVTVPVSFQLQGRLGTGTILTAGLYSMDIARLNWIDPTNGLSSNTTFMSGETDWRTSDVSFP